MGCEPSIDELLGPMSAAQLTDREVARLIDLYRLLEADDELSAGVRAWYRSLAEQLTYVEQRRHFEWRAIVKDPTGVPVPWEWACAMFPEPVEGPE